MYVGPAAARSRRVPAIPPNLPVQACLCVRIRGTLYKDDVRSRIGMQIPFVRRVLVRSGNNPVFVGGGRTRVGSAGSVLYHSERWFGSNFDRLSIWWWLRQDRCRGEELRKSF